MPRIRLLVPVAGHLAEGIPAPGVFTPVDVDDATADAWCDGERAELVPDVADHDAVVAELHADAGAYLAAVQAEHDSRVAELEQQISELTQAAAKKTAKPAADGQ